MNNQQGVPPSRNISNCPEAFHQSLFDLQVLTWIFMEDSTDEHYTLGARIMILTADASTVEENNLLQFALQLLHSNCPPVERPSSSDLIQGLWQHHLDSLRGQTFDLFGV